jgi:hypothetical protein
MMKKPATGAKRHVSRLLAMAGIRLAWLLERVLATAGRQGIPAVAGGSGAAQQCKSH